MIKKKSCQYVWPKSKTEELKSIHLVLQGLKYLFLLLLFYKFFALIRQKMS